MGIPSIGFRNGDVVCKNITFDYTTNPQPAQPGIIKSDGQLLIGSVNHETDIAMSAGRLVSPNATLTIGYAFPDITLDVTGIPANPFVGLIAGGDGANIDPSGGGRITINSDNNTVYAFDSIAANAMSLNAVPALAKLNVIGLPGGGTANPALDGPPNATSATVTFAGSNGLTINGVGDTVFFNPDGVVNNLIFDVVNGAFPDVQPSSQRVKLRSANGTVTLSGSAADTIDFDSLPAVVNNLKIHTPDNADVPPDVTGKFFFTAGASTTITGDALTNTINFDVAVNAVDGLVAGNGTTTGTGVTVAPTGGLITLTSDNLTAYFKSSVPILSGLSINTIGALGYLTVTPNAGVPVSPTLVGGPNYTSGGLIFNGANGVTVTGVGPSTINFDASNAVNALKIKGYSSAGDAQPDNVNHRITFNSANGTVNINAAANAVDFDALPAVVNNLKINTPDLQTATPDATGLFTFTQSGGMTITRPSAHTINFSSASGGGALTTLTPDTGGVVNPTLGNINVLGLPLLAGQTRRLQTETQRIATSTFQVKAPNCALFIVDVNPLYGTHTTIASAISDAAIQVVNSGLAQTVFVRPGLYVENITLSAGVSLSAYTCDSDAGHVQLLGRLTVGNGTCSVSGFYFSTNGSVSCLASTAGGNITFSNCYFNITNANAISITAAATVTMQYSFGAIKNAGFTIATLTAGTLLIQYCTLTTVDGNNTRLTCSNATVRLYYCNTQIPMTYSGNSILEAVFCMFKTGGGINVTTLICNNTAGNMRVSNCFFDAGNQVAITIAATAILFLINCSIDTVNAFAITGAGILNYSPIAFSATSTSINVGGTNLMAVGPTVLIGGAAHGTCAIMGGAGSPNGIVTAVKGSLWLRTDGVSATTRAYINTNGGTTWTGVMTVA